MSDVNYQRAASEGMIGVDAPFEGERFTPPEVKKPDETNQDKPDDQYGRKWGDPLYGVDLTPDDTGEEDEVFDPTVENAFSRIKAYLSEFGLDDMEDKINDLLARGVKEPTSVIYEIRNTEAYQKRFAANVKRVANGLPALAPSTYIGLERAYREALRSAGMLDYFNRQDIFEELMAGDVAPQELYDRVSDAYNEVVNADAATKAQMRELYQVEDKDLVAYFLNPSESITMLKRRATAAKIAGRAAEQAGLKLTAETAEDLAARGVTMAEAQKQFSTIAQQRELFGGLPGMAEETFTQQQQLGAAFGYDEAAKAEIERRKKARVAAFSGGGRFAATTGATSGTAETGVGTAQ